MDFPWFEFLGLMLAFGINAVIPGADFAMVLRQSIAHGRRAALFTSAGIATSILVHGSYTLLGIGVIVSQSLLAFNIIKWIGAAYLVWLAISALRSPAPQPPASDDLAAAKRGDFAAFALGFLTNLLNPKIAMLYLSLLPQFIEPALGNVLGQSITLGFVQILISVSVNAVIAITAGSIAGFLAGRPVWLLIQRWVMGTVLAGLAVRMALEARR